MKTVYRAILAALLLLPLVGFALQAQSSRSMQFYRPHSRAGLNVFEAPKKDDVPFTGLFVRTGGDFSIQFQGISQSNDAGDLVELANNFNLPTANLNFDVQIEDGVRMHLRTYLSSRHHAEAWVKGGYFQVDKLDFISEGFLAEAMEVLRFRFGMDEINYGDTHFRRSDNARALFNPFVGNYIMDSFSTEPFAEISVLSSGFMGLVGLSNGRLNQRPTPGDDGVVVFAKVGYDDQVSDNVRVRLTGSVYHSADKSTRDYLYNGDRAGSRYYQLLEMEGESRPSDFLPRFNPGFPYQTAFQINPFVKIAGFELFGVVEVSSSGTDSGGSYTQLGGEAIYRIGSSEKVYVAARFNSVKGEASDEAATQEITRVNIGGGWYLTDNVLAKVEYVTSTYDGAGWTGKFAGAEFDGVVLEAVIGF